MSILIEDVLLNGKKTSIFIEENRITEIGVKNEAEYVIDGRHKAAFPGFVNTHTHSAMTLLRGYADDMRLHEWLRDRIWPFEAKLTEEDVYWGSKLACIEMIKSGTTCFSDMYWHMKATAKAVREMGLRAVLAEAYIDLFSEDKAEEMKKKTIEFIKYIKGMNESRIKAAVGPHAVYTVSEESLIWLRELAEEEDILIHFHLAETEKENKDCVRLHSRRPTKFLEDIGFLCSRLVAAHSIWLKKSEIKTLSRYGVKVAHNPTSNMKLASGVMPYREMKESGLVVSIGTDGCASNNNLDMIEEMRTAALLHKVSEMNPTVLPAAEALEAATSSGGLALGLDVGSIKERMLADIILIDLKKLEFYPGHNIVSDLVYAAKSDCVDTVICDGRILMQNRKIKEEEEVLQKTKEIAEDIINRDS